MFLSRRNIRSQHAAALPRGEICGATGLPICPRIFCEAMPKAILAYASEFCGCWRARSNPGSTAEQQRYYSSAGITRNNAQRPAKFWAKTWINMHQHQRAAKIAGLLININMDQQGSTMLNDVDDYQHGSTLAAIELVLCVDLC